MIDLIYIMLIAVLFNHLGLAEIITFHSKKNVVLNCSKCLTFWTTLGYSLFITGQGGYSQPLLLIHFGVSGIMG